ncbi:hypothetical protein [Sulfurimonas sp. CS5]|uniref:hypothetical protein n=1 Tax=Sulfurimonas sp. CS5 TaxID=3391145 RepID=UPI0039ECC985
MKRITQIVVLIILCSVITLADEYAVVTNKKMSNLSVSQIRAVFLKKKTFIDNLTIVPINLEARNSIRQKFEKEILHMSFKRLKAYWIKQHYLGHRPPLTMKSEDSIKSFLKKVDGSIGYINIKSVDDNLKVIYKWSD